MIDCNKLIGDNMKKLVFIILCSAFTPFTSLLAPFMVNAWADKSSTPLSRCNVASFHPTQLSVGYREVIFKKNLILQKNATHELDQYLKEHAIPMVLGPNHEIFITDHHHLARALFDLNIASTYCSALADFSRLQEPAFWQQMEQRHWVYPFDQELRRIPYAQLPKTVSELKDDPYRSFAKAVQDCGGYHDTNEFYAEFKWAAYFRSLGSKINLGNSEPQFIAQIPIGLKAAKQEAAQSLPGFSKKILPQTKNCPLPR